ncbi:MAG TPA: hypothetical protein VEH57_07930 [Thermoplasmata archaeon]|nr:hypothetical protein [Thermoplasmata archaeon]
MSSTPDPSSSPVPPTSAPSAAPVALGAASPQPPQGSAPSAASPPPSRKGLWIAVGAIAVALLLVFVLAIVGAIPIFSSSGSTKAAAPLTYDQALPIADATAAGAPGGTWALLVASGIDSAVSVSETVNITSTKNCNYTALPGAITSISVPGASDRNVGAATLWAFIYRSATGALLFVLIMDGKGTAEYTVAGGQSCTSLFGLFTTVPATVVDSSAAASAVQPYAATFLSANPNASALYGLVGGLEFLGHGIGAEWEVNYTTCPPISTSTSGTGVAFNATVNATTGAVIYSATWGSFRCSGSSVTLSQGGDVSPALMVWGPASAYMRHA